VGRSAGAARVAVDEPVEWDEVIIVRIDQQLRVSKEIGPSKTYTEVGGLIEVAAGDTTVGSTPRDGSARQYSNFESYVPEAYLDELTR
jgi:hypothetical protein